MAKCEICGTEFIPNRSSRQKLCGARACKVENKRRVRAKREGMKLTDRTPRPCTVCGELYTPHQSNQTTCSNFHCKTEARKLAAVRRYHAQRASVTDTCPICNRKFIPKVEGQKTCGGWRCVNVFKKQSVPKETRSCRYCQSEFQTTARSGRVFCCDSCKEHWNDEQRLISKAEQIADPFPAMQTMVPGLSSWDCPEMDPMSCGTQRVMLNFEAEAARRAA